jgi:hypothetical protein
MGTNSARSGLMNASLGAPILRPTRRHRRSAASPISTRRRPMSRASSISPAISRSSSWSIRPRQPSPVLSDYGNRGNKRVLQLFNDAPASNDPRSLAHAGEGFLMRRGYTVASLAWQGDLLPGNGRLLLDLPVARAGDWARPNRVHRRPPRNHDIPAEWPRCRAQPSDCVARPARGASYAAALFL